MVNPTDKLARFLGAILLAGSTAGIALAFVVTGYLVVMGAVPHPWPLSARGWWGGEFLVWQVGAGIGLLVLGATPVVMLALFGVREVRAGGWSNALTALVLFLILAAGVAMNLLA